MHVQLTVLPASICQHTLGGQHHSVSWYLRGTFLGVVQAFRCHSCIQSDSQSRRSHLSTQNRVCEVQGECTWLEREERRQKWEEWKNRREWGKRETKWNESGLIHRLLMKRESTVCCELALETWASSTCPLQVQAFNIVRILRPESAPLDWKLPKMSEMEPLQGEKSVF